MTSLNETFQQKRQEYLKKVAILYCKHKMGFKIDIDELEKLATNLLDFDYVYNDCFNNYSYWNSSFIRQISGITQSYNALNKQERVKENKNTNPMKDRSPTNDENLKLFKFDGKHCNYPQFEQLFTLTYENECYQPHEQFIAFKNLIGEFGEGVMDGLQPTLEGLAIAKNLMKNKYLNPQNIKRLKNHQN